MAIFYQEYLDQLSPKSIKAFCKKCTSYGDCDLTNGSGSSNAIHWFEECEELQAYF